MHEAPKLQEHPAVKTYKSFVNLTVSTAKKAFKKIEEYGGFPEKQNILDIYSLVDYLNTRGPNLFSVKRLKIMENGNTVEMTLKEELEEIVKEFTNEVAKIAPDPTPALSLPFVSDGGDGTIVIGGDMVIDPKTFGGAITVEILNAQARGEDPEEIIKALSEAGEEIKDKYGGVEENRLLNIVTPQGLYKVNTPTWNDGTIPYKWEHNVSSELKETMRRAMDEWQKATGNRIKFEYDDSYWTDFLTTIGAYRKLVIKEEDIDAAGLAIVGSFGWWQSYIKIDPDYRNHVCVCLHELGHVIGLRHEHQREDRDDYINIDLSKIPSNKLRNYEKIPFRTTSILFQGSIEWVWIKVRVGWWTVWIPVPIFTIKTTQIMISVENAWATPEYDYFSIMHYSGYIDERNIYITSKVNKTNIFTNWNGVVVTNMITGGQPIPYNTNITPLDVQTVLKIYSK